MIGGWAWPIPWLIYRLVCRFQAWRRGVCQTCNGEGRLDDDLAWDIPGSWERRTPCPTCNPGGRRL